MMALDEMVQKFLEKNKNISWLFKNFLV
jgi:hypothetical protein